MKKPHLFALVIGICMIPATMAFGQIDFFPPGAEWFYASRSPGLLQYRGYTHYIYSGDTIILGENAKMLRRISYEVDYNDPTILIDTQHRDPIYLAQRGDSILYYNKYDTLFQFQWRFDVQTGDEFSIPDEWLPYTMTIDSTEIQQYGSLEVKKIWISGGTGYGQWGEDLIYDRFGPVSGFNYYGCWGFYDCYSPTLCRYRSDEAGQVDFPGAVCDVLMTDVAPIHATGLIVYPNPFSDAFYVRVPEEVTDEVQLDVYTVQGQWIQRNIISSHSDGRVIMAGACPGTYVCKVRTGERVFATRIVKL